MKREVSTHESYVSSRYDRTAWFYQGAAHLYSGGQILASKRWQLRNVRAGDKLLFVGAGSGEDVLIAAEKGAEITVVELAPKMLANLVVKLKQRDLTSKVSLICGDAFEHTKVGHYDMVCANYFLNVFSPQMMEKMLQHLVTLVQEGGRLSIADFAPLNGNFAQVWMQSLYYYSAVTAFHFIAKNPFHRIYDYEPLVQSMGLNLVDQACFRVVRTQSDWYRTLEFEKQTLQESEEALN